ncbi:hypothetical protein EVAR_89761_1 [Eumeta japonica]|uniref:Uncharacterized protein n=1 Tax=Eumeta variegata TaxID=151549 RepID=A0A4C1XFW3_EUMVA|nr:hypothetical protein EVAR_89761_1 [Eumeta japonica]
MHQDAIKYRLSGVSYAARAARGRMKPLRDPARRAARPALIRPSVRSLLLLMNRRCPPAKKLEPAIATLTH